MTHLSQKLSGQKHLNEEELILLYYREPGVSAEMQTHARQCGECSAAYDSLARTLNRCDDWRVPDPDGAFEQSVWARLAPQLAGAAGQNKHRARNRFVWVWPRWVAAGVIAAALCVAFIAGRASRKSEPALIAGLSEQARERILAISITDHLDRAEMLLTGISNASESDTAELMADRSRAQDLVEEGRLIRSRLHTGGPSATLSLLDEVERFMLEVANEPDAVDGSEIRRLQERARNQSLLFKVRIIESNLRTRDFRAQGQTL